MGPPCDPMLRPNRGVQDATPRQLIVGFDVGSFGMLVGETRKLCIPPVEGYGNL